jgi:carbon monoxide dehydrogenase subunit G
VVPDYESVSVTVDRNTISEDPTITTTFNGGKGLGMVQSMTVTLIRSDCVTDVQTRADPGIGTSVTQMGTMRTDRVKVDVLMTSGVQYTVIDGLYPFPAKI